jgi:hypothetical protein
VLCALGMGILILPVPAWWAVRYCYVGRAVRAFQANPSQAGTDKLIALLEERRPTRRQGAKILQLLLQPKIVTRSAYPVGRKLTISILSPFRLRFHTSMTCRLEVLADGQESATHSSFVSLGTEPRVLVSPAVAHNCGKFGMELRFYYFLTPPSEGREPYPTNPIARFLYDLRSRIKARPRATIPLKEWYQVGFSVPVDANVVPEDKAEQVQLLSGPELDDRMRATLRPDKSFWSFRIFARCLPANVVFDCFLELPDGTRLRSSRSENQHLTGYAGRDLQVDVWPSEYPGGPSRAHDAKLVFEPDPNYAFEDATIKSIWNGRLEFPIRSTIASEPNRSEDP